MFPPPERIPAGFSYLHTSAAGVHWFMKMHDDGLHADFWSYADIEPLLDRNIAMQNHNDGYSVEGRDKLLKRAASVPFALINKWREEEGFDYFDQNNEKDVNKRLNSREFWKLRTAGGNL